MDVDIVPPPPEDVRLALVAAVERALATEPESAWWRAGAQEAVGLDDDQAVARLRSSAGAERA